MGSHASPRRVKKAPVVGRHSRDCVTKWPENESDLRNAFLADSDYDVRILGGADKALQIMEHRPANWTVYAFDEIRVINFLKDLDFFVHFTHSQYYEEFGRNIMEAMAIGIPVIFPKSFGWF